MLHWAFHTLTLPLGHQHWKTQTIHTVCRPVAPLRWKCLLTLWIFRPADVWLKSLFVLFDYLWAISRLGFPMMIMTCMIGMCYLLATHVGLGWNMWVQEGGREKDAGTSGSIQLSATLRVASTGSVYRRHAKPCGGIASKTDCRFKHIWVIGYFHETYAKTYRRCFNLTLMPFFLL